jgi:hypothetical protein
MTADRGQGPDAAEVTRHIVETFDDVVVATAGGGTFFSCNQSNWPNFATLTTTNEFDDASALDRPGVFRLNIGLTGAIFRSVVGDQADPDFAALDRLLPHPVYAKQNWVSILNPSWATFETTVMPLLAEAHRIVWIREQKKRPTSEPEG